MARYRVGFCLGGPKAGETVSRDDYAFNVHVFERAPMAWLSDTTDYMPAVKSVTYYHVPAADGLGDFFTLDRSWSASEIMAELMKGYGERAAIESKRRNDPGLDHYVKRALGAGE